MAATLLVAGPVLAALYMRPDLVLVEHVVFEGADQAGGRELRHLADLPNGTPIWGVDADAVARGVERHPWVRSATATVRWPDTVVVELEEHHPVALLHADRLLYVDAEGRPFLPARAGDLDHPHITGIDAGLESVHPGLPGLALRDALWLLTELDSRGLVSRSDISEIAFSQSRGWTVHVGPARILFGHADLHRQVDRLAALLQEGLQLDAPTLVDVAPASVAIVRPLEAPVGG
jgi:hypothetical protein